MYTGGLLCFKLFPQFASHQNEVSYDGMLDKKHDGMVGRNHDGLVDKKHGGMLD